MPNDIYVVQFTRNSNLKHNNHTALIIRYFNDAINVMAKCYANSILKARSAICSLGLADRKKEKEDTINFFFFFVKIKIDYCLNIF